MTERAQKAEPGADPVHVAIRDLQKSYEDSAVLRGVTFDIFRGEINVIIGGSGGGGRRRRASGSPGTYSITRYAVASVSP